VYRRPPPLFFLSEGGRLYTGYNLRIFYVSTYEHFSSPDATRVNIRLVDLLNVSVVST